MRVLLVVLSSVLLFVTSTVECFNDGAPAQACEGMTPGHINTTAQNGPAPFQLLVAAESDPEMNGNQSLPRCVNVTIQSVNTAFKGFFLQARSLANTSDIVGTFDLLHHTNAQFVNCSDGINNAVTHSNSVPKLSESFLWTPPVNYEGKVFFRATVVSNYTAFWTSVDSKTVKVVRQSLK